MKGSNRPVVVAAAQDRPAESSPDWNHIDGYMNLDNVQVTTLVDPDMNICQERAKEYGEKYNTPMKAVQDQREILDDQDIDVVSIASSNHWHALSTIWACQAGKDV